MLLATPAIPNSLLGWVLRGYPKIEAVDRLWIMSFECRRQMKNIQVHLRWLAYAMLENIGQARILRRERHEPKLNELWPFFVLWCLSTNSWVQTPIPHTQSVVCFHRYVMAIKRTLALLGDGLERAPDRSLYRWEVFIRQRE